MTSTSTVTFGAVVERARAAVAQMANRDPDPGDPFRGLYVSDELALTLGDDAEPLSFEQRFDWVCERLRLDPLERAVLALCAAPEVQPDYGRLFAYLHDDPRQRAATPRLVARLLSGPGVTVADVLVCFDTTAQLAVSGALRLTGGGPAAECAAAVGGQLANRLIGSRLADDTAGGRLRRTEPTPLPLGRGAVLHRLAALAGPARELPLAVVGSDAVLAVAAVARRGVVALEASALSDPDACADLTLAAALEDRVPVIHRLGQLAPEDVRRSIERAAELPCRPVLCATDQLEATAIAELTAHVVELPALSAAEREQVWQMATAEPDVRDLAGRFRLDVTGIASAATLARDTAALDGSRGLTRERLWAGARAASSGRLGDLARRLPPGPTWDDLILPERQVNALHAMSSFLAHRDRVIADWGYRAIVAERGLTALFAGESGTGKTLAAQVIAAAAELDVYRVDLSGLFSKWVGETEKNLERMFRAAESANAVLFFDEADVVFGKRTESSDSSDRYANLETAFLLQRIEAYHGVVVLATNLRSNMDDAFVRRLDVVVDFPPPDLATRRRLWGALIPAGAPLADDIDLDFLALRFELSGGGIRNCSLAAALLAAEDGDVIHMHHLVRAVAMEFTKLGRLTVQADFGPFIAAVSHGSAR